MYKRIRLLLCLLLCMQQAQAQISGSGASSSSAPSSVPATYYNIYFYISDPSVISYVTPQGQPVFTVSAINNIVTAFTVSGFQQPYAGSRLARMQKTYMMTVNDTALPVILVSNYPQYFAGWELIPPAKSSFFYTPLDFPNVAGKRNTGYLDSIGAPKAWDYSKGDSSIVIGIHDIEMDTSHLDLVNKLDTFQNTSYLWGLKGTGHGTRTAGLIAGETDINPGVSPYGYYPSIGFNCKLDYVACTGFGLYNIELNCPGFLQTSNRGRRVINLSAGTWGYDTLFKLYPDTTSADSTWPFINMEMMYQEIYENGTLFVAAAGNGYSDTSIWKSRWYNYPSSLYYVFSVSGVGWKNPYNSSATTNVAGLHERVRGDSMTTVTHNSRVDLLAPAYEVGGLDWYGGYSDGTGNKGTSLAAPLVAGTAGLILALDSCHTPYQLEYILKQSANKNIWN